MVLGFFLGFFPWWSPSLDGSRLNLGVVPTVERKSRVVWAVSRGFPTVELDLDGSI